MFLIRLAWATALLVGTINTGLAEDATSLRLVDVLGDVSLLSANITSGEKTPAQVGSVLSPGTTLITGDDSRVEVIADGVVAIVYDNTAIEVGASDGSEILEQRFGTVLFQNTSGRNVAVETPLATIVSDNAVYTLSFGAGGADLVVLDGSVDVLSAASTARASMEADESLTVLSPLQPAFTPVETPRDIALIWNERRRDIDFAIARMEQLDRREADAPTAPSEPGLFGRIFGGGNRQSSGTKSNNASLDGTTGSGSASGSSAGGGSDGGSWGGGSGGDSGSGESVTDTANDAVDSVSDTVDSVTDSLL